MKLYTYRSSRLVYPLPRDLVLLDAVHVLDANTCTWTVAARYREERRDVYSADSLPRYLYTIDSRSVRVLPVLRPHERLRLRYQERRHG